VSSHHFGKSYPNIRLHLNLNHEGDIILNSFLFPFLMLLLLSQFTFLSIPNIAFNDSQNPSIIVNILQHNSISCVEECWETNTTLHESPCMYVLRQSMAFPVRLRKDGWLPCNVSNVNVSVLNWNIAS